MLLEAVVAVDDAVCAEAVKKTDDATKDDCHIIGVMIGNNVCLGDGVDLRNDLVLDDVGDSNWVPSPTHDILKT